jgi:pimeloyl-ACP methyl ester carboxylesterase
MRLHAVEQGRGPPVCLLHGLFGRSQNLASVARALATRCRVLSLDLRNHGASPHAAGMAYAALAEDVRETLAHHAALPAGLLGHSMGGKVAMTLALAEPGAVSRLLVADIAPVAYAHGNARVAGALQGLALRPGLTRAEADAALRDAVPDAGVRGFLLQNLGVGPAPAWRIGLDQIASGIADIEGWADPVAVRPYGGPALFVAGERSDYVGPSGEAAILLLFPRARLTRLAEAGHWLHADQPAAFARLAEDFLAPETADDR